MQGNHYNGVILKEKQMKLKVKSEEGLVTIQVKMTGWKFLQEVNVWQKRNYESSEVKYLQKAMVNFASYGKLESEDARSYAKAILKACDIADEINVGTKQAKDF